MTDPSDLQRSLDLLANRLIEFSKFPKYSLERRIDIFLVPFLPSFVKAMVGRDAQLVAPEFPVLSDLRERGPYADPKSEGLTRRTVNVDYLFRLTGGSGPPEWLFVELKTDNRSFDDDQCDVYAIARLRGMTRLRDDIKFVLEKTTHVDRYSVLVDALPDAEAEDEPIQVAYLAPKDPKDRAIRHVFPRTPAQRAVLPGLEPSTTVRHVLELEDLLAVGGALAPREFAPLWPTVRKLLKGILTPAPSQT